MARQKRHLEKAEMRRLSWMMIMTMLAVPAVAEVDAVEVFERLKALEGSWQGHAEGHGEAAESGKSVHAVHDFRVSAGGTVVMETMAPGSEHEMINMYHLDGDGLLLTHYCAGGNQPQLRLDRGSSTTEKLVFDFVGGTNLDPEAEHIHSARITLVDSDHVESSWTSNRGDTQVGRMVFHLSRE